MNEKFHKDCYSLADHCTCNLLLLLKMLRPRSWTIWFWMQMAKLKNLFLRFKSPRQGCMGSSRSSEEAVRNFGWIWGWSAVKSCSMLYLLHAYNIFFYFWQQSKMSFPATASMSSLTKTKQQVTRSWSVLPDIFGSCFLLRDGAGIWTWGHPSCSGLFSAHWYKDCLV